MSNQEGTVRNVTVDGDIQRRSGVFANIAMATSQPGFTMLDFLLVDRPNVGEDTDGAVHQARVIMTPDALVQLKDMLVEHIATYYSHESE